MRFNVVLLICAVVAATEAKTPAPSAWCSGAFLQEVVSKCMAIYGTTQADVDDYVYIRPAASERAKCFRGCLFDVCKAFNADGSFVDNVPQTTGYLISRRTPQQRALGEKVATHCVNTIPAGLNICDTTEAFLQCMGANTPAEFTFAGAL